MSLKERVMLLSYPGNERHAMQGHRGKHQCGSGGREERGTARARAFIGVLVERHSHAGKTAQDWLA